MNKRTNGVLDGLRVLVVEDEHLVAMALCDDLEESGALVVGPASTVENALRCVADEPLDLAVLDIKLQSQMVFPVADALTGKGVPFLFTTGYDAGMVPDEYLLVPKCEKPSADGAVIRMLAQIAGRAED